LLCFVIEEQFRAWRRKFVASVVVNLH